MNLADKQILRDAVFAYLKTLGYPNMTDEQILNAVPDIWNHLNEKGLVKPGMNFKDFAHAAASQKLLRDIKNEFGI